MATWIVEGASRETGEDVKISVEAETQGEAAKKVRLGGVLVSSIQKDEPVDDLAEAVAAIGGMDAPPTLQQRMRGTVNRIPEYADILSGSHLLRFFAGVLMLLGIISLLVGVVGFAVGIIKSNNGSDDTAMGTGMTLLISGVASGIPCLVGSVALRMYASLAIAMRDIARNSFTKS